MAIATGTKLGPYEIVSAIGAGGMGEVYRARDTRLDRTVAIKVLPSHLSGNAELRQRFEREARAVSSLSHPHICTLYDIGHQDGVDYLVMEYIEGETLADRLTKGALPTEQVLRYGIEIADALDKAHRQGVVHRDLKPGNIMLTKSGAKLLDFGLAKLKATGSGPVFSASSEVPTEHFNLTGEGKLLGTFQYMAPEQLEGQEADARTDIFAFGAVVYEMASGRKAFTGKSQASLIAAILERDPAPISTIEPMAPPALDRVVKKCLSKDPDERWQSAHDVRSELDWIAEGSLQVVPPTAAAASPKSRERLPWVVAAFFLLGLLATLPFAIGYFRRAPTGPKVIRSSVLPPENVSFLGISQMAISPNGLRLAIVARSADGKQRLWVRPLDALSAQSLAGTDGASLPFWSPDSRFIGFFATGKLKKIDASGGPPQTLSDAPFGRGGTWNPDGVILFAPDTRGPLHRVSAAGGTSAPVTKLDESLRQLTHRWPYFLPDGHHFLYRAGASIAAAQTENNGVYSGSLESNKENLVLHADTSVAYASGYLLFWREKTLMAQGFDAGKLQLTGDAFPIAEQVQFDFASARAVFSVSENGILTFQSGAATGGYQLIWLDRGGKQTGIIGGPDFYGQPALSPDGQRVVVTIFDPSAGSTDIWLHELSRGVRTRFTFDPAFDTSPIWSPDGRSIVFNSTRKGRNQIYQKASSGAGGEEVLFESDENMAVTSWTSDRRFIAYRNTDTKTNTKDDIWILPLFGDRKPFPFLQTRFNERFAQFSPDGQWIAYVSDESGSNQVYIAPFPGPGGKWQVSTGGGTEPRWRGDGKELFFLATDDKLMAVEVRAKETTLEIGNAQTLFETRQAATLPGDHYDVTRDGKRFLIDTLGEGGSVPITLVVNWTANLKK